MAANCMEDQNITLVPLFIVNNYGNGNYALRLFSQMPI